MGRQTVREQHHRYRSGGHREDAGDLKDPCIGIQYIIGIEVFNEILENDNVTKEAGFKHRPLSDAVHNEHLLLAAKPV